MRSLWRILASVFFVATLGFAPPAPRLPAVPHVFVIVMENKDPSEIVGSRHAPYITSLAKRYGLAANYYGVTHPSLPNYVASLAGDFFNTYDDWDGYRFGATNLVDQLEAHHLSWKAYMGGLPSQGYLGDMYPKSNLARYESKHDPFMLMRDVRTNPSRRKKVVPDTQLVRDLKRGRVPALSYVSPDMCHDMHGIIAKGSPCPNVQSKLIQAGDRYLAGLIPRIMKSRAWSGDSTIFVVWDEAEKSIVGCCDSPGNDGGGRVPAIVIAREGVRHYTSRTAYNHYSLLKTLQIVWKLGCLAHTCDGKHVRPMTEFLRN